MRSVGAPEIYAEIVVIGQQGRLPPHRAAPTEKAPTRDEARL